MYCTYLHTYVHAYSIVRMYMVKAMHAALHMEDLVFIYLRVVQLYPVHPVLHPQMSGSMQIPPL